ncbi:hypothetical protein X734_31945 [Mesorhizobium sp. L2C084A000]|nr:hypothetical protein X734_31945 [Mesorhizobium sp. L2C084A000]
MAASESCAADAKIAQIKQSCSLIITKAICPWADFERNRRLIADNANRRA